MPTQRKRCVMDDEVRVATATTDSTEALCDVLQYCVYQPGSFSTEELQILLPSLQQLYDYAVEVGLISEGDQCAIPHIGKNPKAFLQLHFPVLDQAGYGLETDHMGNFENGTINALRTWFGVTSSQFLEVVCICDTVPFFSSGIQIPTLGSTSTMTLSMLNVL